MPQMPPRPRFQAVHLPARVPALALVQGVPLPAAGKRPCALQGQGCQGVLLSALRVQGPGRQGHGLGQRRGPVPPVAVAAAVAVVTQLWRWAMDQGRRGGRAPGPGRAAGAGAAGAAGVWARRARDQWKKGRRGGRGRGGGEVGQGPGKKGRQQGPGRPGWGRGGRRDGRGPGRGGSTVPGTRSGAAAAHQLKRPKRRQFVLQTRPVGRSTGSLCFWHPVGCRH